MHELRLPDPDVPMQGYNVQTAFGCRVVFGKVPINDVMTLSSGFSDKALMAIDIADRIGASLVMGEPGDLEALRNSNLPVSKQRMRDGDEALRRGLPPTMAEWLRTGDRGQSSNAMCKRIFGIPQSAGGSHPHDPSDLHRCVQFLDAAGAHAQVAMMADVSPEWERLVEHWDELVMMLRQERAVGASAPKTYALMNNLRN